MFIDYTKSDEISFKHARGIRDAFGKEFHNYNEILLLIGKSARVTSDNLIEQINANSLVLIPKEQFHQFDPIGSELYYHRYVLQFSYVDGLEQTIDSVMDQVKVIHNVHPETVNIFNKMAALRDMNLDQKDVNLLLRSYFIELMMDLKYKYINAAVTHRNMDTTVSKIIAYIDAHYLEDITISSIAQALNFSETYISHRFKEIMNISIYNYILQKKLIHAYSLIRLGTQATDAAVLCGFNEYSGFYKMYKKYYGFGPSKTNKHEDRADA